MKSRAFLRPVYFFAAIVSLIVLLAYYDSRVIDSFNDTQDEQKKNTEEKKTHTGDFFILQSLIDRLTSGE